MKKITLFNYTLSLILFLTLTFNTNAQLQNTNWYFGNQTGLNFNDGTQPPTVITNNIMSTNGSAASVSDESGNLLFYTNGINIWNNTHQIMPNGNGLFGNTSISQSVIIVPDPNNINKYYVLSNHGNVMGLSGLYYSIVDMSLDGGLGDVDINEKNVQLLEFTGEKLTTALNPNDNTYWVVSFAPSDNPELSDTFYSYKIDATGITLFNQSTFTFSFTESPFKTSSQMKISPDVLSLAMIHNTVDTDINGIIIDSKSLYTFDFDNTTGIVSSMNDSYFLVDALYGYGLEFSPDSNLLYVSITDAFSNGSEIGEIFQVDYRNLMATLPFLIYDGKDAIFGLQLGIDGKIYIVNSSGNLSTIDTPNILNIGANYAHESINLNGLAITELPQFVPKITSVPKSLLKIYNTSYANDTITKLKAKDTGVVVFGEIGVDNEDNLPGLSPGFIAEFDNSGTLLNSDTQQLPYQIPLDLQENTFKWDLLSTSISLNGGVNNNYKLSKFNNDNSLQFEITTVNINEDLLEDDVTGNTYLVFPASTNQDISIRGSSGVIWTRSATQQQDIQDGTIYTKTLNLAKFDSSGNLIGVSELLNYKWSRTTTGGTALVDFLVKIIGDNATIYFTTVSRDEGIFTDATKIYLTNGEFHKKGEWLISYNINSNTFQQAKLIGQNGSITPNELIFNQSTLYRKRKKKLFKLDQNLNDIDSLIMNKLKILESNKTAGTFIIRGDNKRTIKKIDANFNEIWSKNLGKKFEITHASEAPNGEVYVSGSYIVDATLSNPDNLSLPHNTGNDVFIAKVDGLPISLVPLAAKSNVFNRQNTTDHSLQNIPKNRLVTYPNPFEKNISIKSNNKGNYSVEIYDMNGKLVFRQKANMENNSDFKLNTSNLKKGIYHIKITDSKSKSIYKKVIKI